MIAVDTNIIVRLITQDDPTQAKLATDLIVNNDIFISDTVLLETAWVLNSAYRFSITDIIDALRKVLGLPTINVAHTKVIANALNWTANGLDIADAFHLAISQRHSQRLVTFDQRFAKRNPSHHTVDYLA